MSYALMPFDEGTVKINMRTGEAITPRSEPQKISLNSSVLQSSQLSLEDRGVSLYENNRSGQGKILLIATCSIIVSLYFLIRTPSIPLPQGAVTGIAVASTRK